MVGVWCNPHIATHCSTLEYSGTQFVVLFSESCKLYVEEPYILESHVEIRVQATGRVERKRKRDGERKEAVYRRGAVLKFERIQPY